MRKLLIALATTVALVGPAAACMPNTIGDIYKQNGVYYVVVKLADQCGDSFYVRPYRSNQTPRKVRRFDVQNDEWVLEQN